jgi:ABC-type dipeptide/oligopeptide/nickel transport system ATPase component
MQNLTNEEFEGLVSNRALAIIGDAGTGKTFLAKTIAYTYSKKQPLLIKHHEGIKEFDSNRHDSIVLDDANLRHLKTEQDIINWLELAVKGTASNIRHLYGCKHIPEDTRLILTINDIRQICEELTRQISRRLTIVELDKPITLKIDSIHVNIFNHHNHIYNDEIQMRENQRI